MSKQIHWLLNLGALCSMVAVCIVVLYWLLVGHADPRIQYLNITNQWHVGMHCGGDMDARVDLFNGAYGPYCGSIQWVAGPHGQRPNTPREHAFGDTLGIYFRGLPIPLGRY